MAIREINLKNQMIKDFLDARDLATDAVVIAIFVLFLTFLRPFGMHQIDILYAGFFWFVICSTGYVIYSPTMFFLSKLLDRNLPEWINTKATRLVLSTLAASVLMGLLAPFIINLFFNYFDSSYLQSIPSSIMYCTVIGGIIAGVSSIKSLVLQQQQQLKQNAEELAKKLANPISSLISLPFQNNTDLGIGNYNGFRNTLNIQPVIPISLSENLNLIARAILPVIYQSNITDFDETQRGLGDAVVSAFLSPSNSKNGLTWGAGPVFLVPTGTNDFLTTKKFGIGPTAVALYQNKGFTIGGLINQIWSIAGSNERSDVSTMFFQPFFNYNWKTIK